MLRPSTGMVILAIGFAWRPEWATWPWGRPDSRLSLTISVPVLIVSGALAVYDVLLASATRLWHQGETRIAPADQGSV